jgi:cell pole-organizing protein PopZ
MQSPAREPTMEDILASIKKVIAEEKDLRASGPVMRRVEEEPLAAEISDDVLELNEPVTPPVEAPVDLGPPLVDQEVARSSRQALETLTTIAATAPPAAPVNPLEEMIRELLRPILKQWLDDHLPAIVDEHVKREITRITGRPL